MKEEIIIPKLVPKGEVLRKAAQRYPDLRTTAVEAFLGIKRVAQEADCDTRDVLEPYGLSEGKFYVLADLLSEELLGHEAPSPSEIAEHLGVTRATITGLLDGLERDDFLERWPDSRDRRALTVHMTDKARKFLDEFLPQTCRRFSALMTNLTESEQRTLIALLAKIAPQASETP